jgi:hypothetical protein
MDTVKKCIFKVPQHWQTLLSLNAYSLQRIISTFNNMTDRLVAAPYMKPKMCYATHRRPNAALAKWKHFTKQHSKFCKMCFCIIIKFTPVYPKWVFCYMFTDIDYVVCASVILFMHITCCTSLILLWLPQRVMNLRTYRVPIYGILSILLLIFTLKTKFFWMLYLQTSSVDSVHCSRPHWDMKPALS